MQADGVVQRYAIGGAVGATFYLKPVATLDGPDALRTKPACSNSLKPLRSTLRAFRMSSCATDSQPPGGDLNNNPWGQRMTFDLTRILESKREYRKRLAARPIEEKLAMLDALRARALVLHRSRAELQLGMLREEPPAWRTGPRQAG